MQFQNLLVAIDFSPSSRMTLDYALAFARRCRARLTLLHVIESSTILTLTFPEEAMHATKEEQEKSEAMLAALLAQEDKRDLDIETMVRSGNVEEQILSTINETQIDLLVMGNHGHALKALPEVKVPTLTVGDAAKAPAFDRILMATDLSEVSKQGLNDVIDVSEISHAHVAAVHAVEVGVEGGAEAAVYLGASRVQEARTKFDEFKAETARRNIELETIVVEGRAAEAILNTAENNSADFIVITKQALPGSITDSIISNARIPVLMIPVFAEAEPERTDEPRVA
jgi:nucleotide-binding universal stress UspA family protein